MCSVCPALPRTRASLVRAVLCHCVRESSHVCVSVIMYALVCGCVRVIIYGYHHVHACVSTCVHIFLHALAGSHHMTLDMVHRMTLDMVHRMTLDIEIFAHIRQPSHTHTFTHTHMPFPHQRCSHLLLLDRTKKALLYREGQHTEPSTLNPKQALLHWRSSTTYPKTQNPTAFVQTRHYVPGGARGGGHRHGT